MSDVIRITDPSQLSEITTKLAALDLSGEPRQLTLVLLQPLANANTLASCLPDKPTGVSRAQKLDIKPLSTAWRKAVIEATPTPHLVFDLSLPRFPDTSLSSRETISASESPKLFWDTSPPIPANQHHILIRTREFVTMINSITLAVRMRCEGKLSFGIVWDEKEGFVKQVVEWLRKQLAATEKDYKSTEKGIVQKEIEERVSKETLDSSGDRKVEQE